MTRDDFAIFVAIFCAGLGVVLLTHSNPGTFLLSFGVILGFIEWRNIRKRRA